MRHKVIISIFCTYFDVNNKLLMRPISNRVKTFTVKQQCYWITLLNSNLLLSNIIWKSAVNEPVINQENIRYLFQIWFVKMIFHSKSAYHVWNALNLQIIMKVRHTTSKVWVRTCQRPHVFFFIAQETLSSLVCLVLFGFRHESESDFIRRKPSLQWN